MILNKKVVLNDNFKFGSERVKVLTGYGAPNISPTQSSPLQDNHWK